MLGLVGREHDILCLSSILVIPLFPCSDHLESSDPLITPCLRAQATVHRMHHDSSRIQLCTLMNIKSECRLCETSHHQLHTHRAKPTAGGCSEDCKYCSQSSRYSTETKASRLVDIEPVLKAAREAKANGSTRFCMGAAWRDLAGRKSGFEKILKMVTEVRGMGMEGESWV